MRPLIVTTVDRLDLVLGLMGAQVGVRRHLSLQGILWVGVWTGGLVLGLMGAHVGRSRRSVVCECLHAGAHAAFHWCVG